jgi:hypothetical protein
LALAINKEGLYVDIFAVVWCSFDKILGKLHVDTEDNGIGEKD